MNDVVGLDVKNLMKGFVGVPLTMINEHWLSIWLFISYSEAAS